MLGLPSFSDITVGIARLAVEGPIKSVVTGAAGREISEAAAIVANGDQSPEAIAARNRIQDLVDNNFDGEFHDPRIPESMFGNVRGQDLDELYRKAQSIDVGAMDTLFQMWSSRAQNLEAGLAEFQPQILTAIAESWSGAAASAAAAGIADYVNKTQSLVSSTKIVADKVGLVKSAVEVTKHHVQPAPETGWATTVAGWVPGPTWKLDSQRTTAAEEATYSILEKVYHPGIREGDTGQPRIPPAYNPVHEPGEPGGPGPVLPRGTQNGQPVGHNDTGGGPQPELGPEATTDPGVGETRPGAQQPAPAPGESTAAPAGLDTSPAATTPSGTTAPSVPGSPTTTPGSPGGPSGAGPGGPGGSPGTSPGAPAPGQTVPGPGAGPGAGRPGSAPAAAAAGPGAGRGAPGMGMMPPGGARGKDEGDNEKEKSEIAQALVTQEHGDELTGLDPAHRPRTIPPVLGE